MKNMGCILCSILLSLWKKLAVNFSLVEAYFVVMSINMFEPCNYVLLYCHYRWKDLNNFNFNLLVVHFCCQFESPLLCEGCSYNPNLLLRFWLGFCYVSYPIPVKVSNSGISYTCNFCLHCDSYHFNTKSILSHSMLFLWSSS